MRRVTTTALATALLFVALAPPAAAQSWRTVAKARQLRGQDFLEVNVEFAVGKFELTRSPDALLYRFESRYDEDLFRLHSNYIESGNSGALRIDIEDRDGVNIQRLRDYDDEAGSLKLGLTGDTPIDLNLKLGATEARLDLGGLKLRNIVFETGASNSQVRFSEPNSEVAESCIFKAGAAALELRELGNSRCRTISVSGGVGAIELDFSGDWKEDANADINVGLGGIELHIPAELGVRIEKNTFLMAFDAPGFEKQNGGVYLSRNWDTASRRLTINVSGALGGISVARL